MNNNIKNKQTQTTINNGTQQQTHKTTQQQYEQ